MQFFENYKTQYVWLYAEKTRFHCSQQSEEARGNFKTALTLEVILLIGVQCGVGSFIRSIHHRYRRRCGTDAF
jgi:hypothetical protein